MLQLADTFHIKNAEDIIKQTIESFKQFSSLAKENGLDNPRKDKISTLIEEGVKQFTK